MNRNSAEKPKPMFLLLWMITTSLFGFIGWVVVIYLAFNTSISAWDASYGLRRFLLWLLMGCLYGGIVSLAQYWFLRCLGKNTIGWILVTMAGQALYFIWAFVLHTDIKTLPDSMLSGLVGGLVLGSAQWIFLRRRLKKSRSWIVATILGSILGEVITYLLPANGHPSFLWAIGPSVITSIVGITTGIALSNNFPAKIKIDTKIS